MILVVLLPIVVGVVLTMMSGRRGDRPIGVVDRRPDPPRGGPSGRDLWRLLVQLGLVEGRRLVRHPVFLAGVALSVYLLALAGFRQMVPSTRSQVLAGMGLIPIAGGTLLAVNLGAVRDRRSGTEELYASMPAVPSARTPAHLLSVAAAVLAGCLLLALAGVLTVTIGGPISGWKAGPLDLIQAPLVIAAAGAVGVLFARWIATPAGILFGPILIVVLAVGSPLGPRALPFFPVPPGHAVGWHVLFIASFTMLAVAVAMLRHLRRLPVEVFACGALAGTVTAVLLQGGMGGA